MSILLPLGFLGLLGIVALIIIYIIRPNYQQKIVSSTYIWNLSLKYRRKKIPLSRFRNIILFIIQVLIIALCAMMLAYPAILSETDVLNTEKIFVIDASASMRIVDEGSTRYERAVDQVLTETRTTLNGGGTVTIIMADNDPYYLAQRATYVNADAVYEDLSSLIEGNLSCSYSSADMDKAAELAQDILNENPQSEVYLYTGTDYIYQSEFNVVDVSTDSEWNAAILGCTAELDFDNYYEFTIDVACYGSSRELTFCCEVINANGNSGSDLTFLTTLTFDASKEEQTIILDAEEQSAQHVAIYSWETLHIYVEEAEDCLVDDNSFYYYGGTKDTITVQYVSSYNNIYVPTALSAITSVLSGSYNVQVTEVDYNLGLSGRYATSGFDVYIFEHSLIPDELPTDGIVILLDPEGQPRNADYTWAGTQTVDSSTTLTSSVSHDLTRNINASEISIAKYQIITGYVGYTPLMFYEENPILLYKNEADSKIVILALDLNYSNMAITTAFPLLMYNIFKYYLPVTVSDYLLEVGDTLTLNARGASLTFSGQGTTTSYSDLPVDLTISIPGTYTITQQLINDQYLIENIFVKIPSVESNVSRQVDNLPSLVVDVETEDFTIDLLIYFAIALAALLFIEWLLQAKEYF